MGEKFYCRKCKKELKSKNGYDKGYCFKCISDISPAIIIYTMPEVLEHKKKDGISPDYCYWQLKHKPQKLDRYGRSKIYFATKGFIRGYFIIFDISGNRQGTSSVNWFEREKDKSISDDESFSNRRNNIELHFHSDSWIPLKKPIPTKSFQGFKYAVKVSELNTVIQNKENEVGK